MIDIFCFEDNLISVNALSATSKRLLLYENTLFLSDDLLIN